MGVEGNSALEGERYNEKRNTVRGRWLKPRSEKQKFKNLVRFFLFSPLKT